jgi:hypothetical protein
MLRSVAIGAGTPAATFLKSLQADLRRFGREDVRLMDTGDVIAFVWDPEFKSAASIALRRESLRARLEGRKAELEAAEAALPAEHFEPFDIDFAQIAIEIVACARGSAEARLFEYLAEGQSVAAETRTMRTGRFLIYDRTAGPDRVAGLLALRSPMYFDGARDAHLGWPPLFITDPAGVRSKNPPAIALRNAALKSIFNLSVCMAVAPYDVHGFGRLIAALAFSGPVIETLEATYGDPVLGLTTTGGWGGSAGQYERIRLSRDIIHDQRAKLFQRTHGASRSLNFPMNHFSPATFNAAFAALSASSVSARPYRGHAADEAVRNRMLFAAAKLVGVPRRALASNVVAHSFGAVSGDCRRALESVAALAAPPAIRSLDIAAIQADWAARGTPPRAIGVTARRLSEDAT